MEIILHPIGVIRTPFNDQSKTPIQAARSQATGQVLVDPAYAAGLQDLEGFSHIILLYVFHASSGYSLLVKPFLDDKEHGLFATRHPGRPNPIGLSVVRLLARKKNVLEIEGVDMLDNTPLIDIKPFVPEFDLHTQTRAGWYEIRAKD
jgi:tRNA-Thr(GGU) m(6)t(6)A37 methyltransferase TsaA